MFKLFNLFGNNLSIRRKGLVLVGIPLLFQIGLSVVLGTLYARAEQQALEEARARFLMVRINTIVMDIYKGGQLLVVFTAAKDDASRKQWLRMRDTIVEDMESLKNLATTAKSKHAYAELLEISNNALRVLEESYRRSEDGTPYGFVQMFPLVRKFVDEMIEELQSVFTTDLHSQAAGALAEDKTRQILATILYVGIAIDILIAIGLSVFFASSIEQRLATIQDNTRRLREKVQLLPNVKGSDEIASLDRDFHELSTALKESERMRSEFLSMVGHDIRTPLMSAELSLDIARTQLTQKSGNTEVIEELDAATKNMERVMSLIRDLLDLERGASGKLSLELEDVAVQSLINRACKTVRALADQKNVAMDITCGDEEVIGDRKRLEQLLLNLLSNAVKFAPPGSAVAISAKQADDFVEIRVCDSGVGVPEDDRERIFERFEQSQMSTVDQGTGLGLAICKTIIDAHEGQIGFEPNQPYGSQFWFKIKSAS